MIDEAFESKALEYAINVLQRKKHGKGTQELDFAISVLKERKELIRAGKEEQIGIV